MGSANLLGEINDVRDVRGRFWLGLDLNLDLDLDLDGMALTFR